MRSGIFPPYFPLARRRLIVIAEVALGRNRNLQSILAAAPSAAPAISLACCSLAVALVGVLLNFDSLVGLAMSAAVCSLRSLRAPMQLPDASQCAVPSACRQRSA